MSFDLKKSHVEGFLIFKNQGLRKAFSLLKFDVIAKFVIVETSYNFNFIINFSSPYHATNKDRFFLKKFWLLRLLISFRGR